MNTKIAFFLILILLVILMLFYYIDLESNIIILLGLVIVFIIHNIIKKKEHFNINEKLLALETQVDTLIAISEALTGEPTQEDPTKRDENYVEYTNSCPFDANNLIKSDEIGNEDQNRSRFKVLGFETDLDKLALDKENISSLLGK